MKKILLLAFITFTLSIKAQTFTLEHTYDSASVRNNCLGNAAQLLLVNFEVSGERYVKINRCGKVMNIYDLNHSLIKTISMASFPTNGNPYYQLGDVLYLSEQLFDTDNAMEFMYVVDDPISGFWTTTIYKENGTVLFSDNGAALIRPNFEQQMLPIYNTSQGTKMILSYANGQAKVWGLQGTLSTAIQVATQNLISSRGLVSNPRPNPTNQSTTIDYKLPDNVNQGEIIFYNLQGTEMKRYKVDKTFDHLLISTTDIPAGTYYYQLQTGDNTSAGKKLVVIK